jgi:hypothetical protein
MAGYRSSYDWQVGSIYLYVFRLPSPRIEIRLVRTIFMPAPLPFTRHSSSIRLFLQEEEICTPEKLFVVVSF